jgi:hypothetical protein
MLIIIFQTYKNNLLPIVNFKKFIDLNPIIINIYLQNNHR